MSARKRKAKKNRAEIAKDDEPQQSNEQPRRDAPQEDQDPLTQDRRRANAERHLLNITIALPRACHLNEVRLREMAYLFRHKDALPGSEAERAEDDYARRQAVFEIMQAREKYLWERKGESVHWAVTASHKFDIQAALVSTFNSNANSKTAIHLKG